MSQGASFFLFQNKIRTIKRHHKLNPGKSMIRIGVDLGGTKIEAAALDDRGQTLVRKRIPTPGTYSDMVAETVELVTGLEQALGTRARIGLGHPGSINPDSQVIRGANSTWLNGQHLAADICAALDRPVRCANDADCFALSESVDGAGAKEHIVFGVILGTGVGGGIVIDGKPLGGAQNIAGEWGHTALPWLTQDEYPGPACWCGKSGCVEAWLSGPAIAADFGRRTGLDCQSQDILADETELDRYAGRLARALSTVINIIDPDVVVLGGGVSNTPGLAQRVQTALPAHVFSDVLTTRVIRHKHGDSSGVRGAAMLWNDAQ